MGKHGTLPEPSPSLRPPLIATHTKQHILLPPVLRAFLLRGSLGYGGIQRVFVSNLWIKVFFMLG